MTIENRKANLSQTSRGEMVQIIAFVSQESKRVLQRMRLEECGASEFGSG